MGGTSSVPLQEYEIRNRQIDFDFKALSTRHEELIAKYKHEERMAIANQRHKERIRMLEALYETVKLNGREIFEAECDGCRGLPGNSIKY